MLELMPHLPHLLAGLKTTLLLFVAGSLLATVCAFAAGLGRLSRDPIVCWVSRVYIELFRGTSALVQLYWFYFALPLLIGLQMNAIVAGVLVLGLNIGAYGAEVVRGAIEQIPIGQQNAAIALNLTRYQRMRYVIVPQALLAMLPPFGNLLIELLKSTALVSMITVLDLTRAGLDIRDNTLQTAQIFGLLLVIYFLLSSVVTWGMRRLESRLSHGLDHGGTR
ncbi:ectoine/hydroxyectoine ABC transporter permease subunit EhuC [Lignipirellula cremea]|uniref:Glutamine transport system permease protein GlnP n=1 Tax=Lignipirellula cremea TaxID=2528010 RepID=A0A518DXW9_9BACT|nr:ectoine/hydroxyectoine ABC transporter permease subunit EhuC [Lignipirellula cremea]QDU96690.1 Glutamine transport system permease protein GlnP [Lignipirellula cremea]